jgi:RHS repeat-associated protein
VQNGGGTTLAAFTYTLRPSGHRASLTETIGTATRLTEWDYDTLYRLTEETVNNTATAAYTYDAVGNRQTRAITGIPHLPTVAAYTYDANDRLLAADTATTTHDANGNPTNGNIGLAGLAPLTGQPLTPQAVTDTYDHNNRLIKRVAAGLLIEILYDADGNRVAKTVNGATTCYLVDTLNPTGYAQVIEEVTKSGDTHTVQKRYTHGHDLINQDVLQPGDTYQTRYHGYDGLGTVRYLTDPAGALTDTYTYDAFGTLTTRWAAATPTDNVYLYAGEQYDPDLGLYYNRARYLNTDTGRFWTMDDYEGNNREPLSLHKYLYVHGNPINGIDPGGQFFTIMATFSMHMNYVSMSGSLVMQTLDFAQAVAGGMLASQAILNATAAFENDVLWMTAGGAVTTATTAIFIKYIWKWIKYIPKNAVGGWITGTYQQMKTLTAGERGILQAHHILEERHLVNWGLDASHAPAVILSQQEHQIVTSLLRQKLPYGEVYSREAVWEAYQEVYSEVPEWLELISAYFK